MEKSKIEKLKIACNQFYMNKQLDLSVIQDKEFDQLRNEYESEFGSIRNLVDWEDTYFEHKDSDSLDKIIAESNDLKYEVSELIGHLGEIPEGFTINYKYDGASIKAYYKNGRLKSILSTPHLDMGLLRTKSFINMFPDKVDSSIESIQGEVLVDASVYGQLSRNKANGLTNSKDMISEVESEAFIRVYKIAYVDGNWSYLRQRNTLRELPTITRDRLRRFDSKSNELKNYTDLVFASAEELKLDHIPENPIISEYGKVSFQVDGIVLYSRPQILGIKFYYTEFVDVKVLGIQWNRKLNGSFAPVLNVEECELNEKTINYVTASGVPNLINMKMGKGAIVRVILANMTIPKVIEVIKESINYQFPKCDCGYQCTEYDIYGSTLKCSNEVVCDWKYKSWVINLTQSLVWSEVDFNEYKFENYVKDNFNWFLSYLFIDRFNPESKFIGSDLDKFKNDTIDCIKDNDCNRFINEFKVNYRLSELNEFNFEVNVRSTFAVFQTVYLNWEIIDQNYVDRLNEIL